MYPEEARKRIKEVAEELGVDYMNIEQPPMNIEDNTDDFEPMIAEIKLRNKAEVLVKEAN